MFISNPSPSVCAVFRTSRCTTQREPSQSKAVLRAAVEPRWKSWRRSGKPMRMTSQPWTWVPTHPHTHTHTCTHIFGWFLTCLLPFHSNRAIWCRDSTSVLWVSSPLPPTCLHLHLEMQLLLPPMVALGWEYPLSLVFSDLKMFLVDKVESL